jgi:serine/threonine protein kinase
MRGALEVVSGGLELDSAEKTVVPRTPDNLTDLTGATIGRYKLLQQIGEGGFGIVYMAEQTEPVQRKVALKIIKAGMDTREISARFEAERQALALMDHPNIARVLDGGTTEMGRPYFVMELVRGIPITAYCDQANLSTQQRLELFIKVCRAVEHAHQKGVIHRDLKPGNVLVTLHDGEPVPKVIDFGVAKALGQKLTEKTLFTRFEQMIGTPAYMSPEQAALSGLDIDTRSDVYSLGVLLYELLTSVTPLDTEILRQGALDEIRRMIRETDPPKPSTRLTDLAAADVRRLTHSDSEQDRASLRRLLQHRKELITTLRGDLDWITMKALEKDRERRYETVNGLAMDIDRHLKSEPVLARSPSNFYRFQKAIRRHRLVFAAAAAISAALILGAVVSTWQAVRARRAEREQIRLRTEAQEARAKAETGEQKAQTESAKNLQTAQFLRDMLRGVGPSVALGRDTTMLREILDKTAERISNDLANQPEVEAELRHTIGNIYFDLRVVEKAEAMHREALAIRRKLFGNEHLAVAKSLSSLASALRRDARFGESESLYREALAIRRKLQGNEHPDVADMLNGLAIVLQNQGRQAEGVALHRKALAMQRKLLPGGHLDLAYTLDNLAVALQVQGKLAEGEAMYQEALAIRRKTLGNEHPNVALTMAHQALMLQRQGKLQEAEVLLREVLRIRLKLNHPDAGVSFDQLARVLGAEGKSAELETLLGEQPFRGQPASARVLRVRAEIFARRGKWKEASADMVKVLELEPADHQHYQRLAPLLVASGDLQGYRQLCQRILARFGGTNIPSGPGQTNHATVYERMAKNCLILPSAGVNLEGAAELAETAVRLGLRGAYFPYIHVCKGLAEYRQDHFASAVEWVQKAALGRSSFAGVHGQAVLAMAHWQLGQTNEALVAFRQGIQIERAKSRKLESGDLGEAWGDWIIAHTLMDEAKALIEGKGTSRP